MRKTCFLTQRGEYVHVSVLNFPKRWRNQLLNCVIGGSGGKIGIPVCGPAEGKNR